MAKLRFVALLTLLTSFATSLSGKDRMYCHREGPETAATGGGSVRANGFSEEVKPALKNPA
jgi:hypothetical protein